MVEHDVFGNYFMRKHGVRTNEERTTILLVLTKDLAMIFRISLDCQGTRATQKLI